MQGFITVQKMFSFTYLTFRKIYCTKETYGNVTQYDAGTVPCHSNISPRNETIQRRKRIIKMAKER